MAQPATDDITVFLPAVRNVARKIASRLPINPVMDTDDLTQEGMLRVLRAADNGGLQSPQHRVAQACVAAKYGMVDALRRNGPVHFISLNEPVPGSDTDRIQLLPSAAIDPLQQALQAESWELLRSGWQHLSKRQRTVLLLYYAHEHTQGEIATMLSCSRELVAKTLRAALCVLGEFMGVADSGGAGAASRTPQSRKVRYTGVRVRLLSKEVAQATQQSMAMCVPFRKHLRAIFLAGLDSFELRGRQSTADDDYDDRIPPRQACNV